MGPGSRASESTVIRHLQRGVYRFIGALAEVFDEPFPGLVMDKDIEMADAGFFEAVFKRRISAFGHFFRNFQKEVYSTAFISPGFSYAPLHQPGP